MIPQPYAGSTLDQADLPRIEFLVERVRKQLLRGEWLTLAYLSAVCKGSEASVSARIRDLRKEQWGGYFVEKKRLESGIWLYRIPKGQGRLF